MKTINRLAAAFLFAAALVPSIFAQTATFTGKWEATVTFQRPDGSDGDTDPILLNLTQKDKELTGTFGDGQEAWKIEKGVIDADTATFEVQQPNGPLLKFSVEVIKGKLEGGVQITRNGVVRAKGRITGAKAK